MSAYTQRQNELNKYRKARKRKKVWTSFTIFIYLIIAAGIVWTIFYAPIFNITKVYSTGNIKLSESEIIAASGCRVGNNIFRSSISSIKAQVTAIPYVRESNVRREFPNRVKIWVRESTPMAIISKNEQFLVIDETGKVLEIILDQNEYSIPTIRGLDVDKYIAGEKFGVTNSKNMDISIICLNEIINSDIHKNIISIDVTNLISIGLNYENRINVNLGEPSNMEYKIRMLKNIVDTKIAPHEQGVLDFSGENPYFRKTD